MNRLTAAENNSATAIAADKTGWSTRHDAAVATPKREERAILGLIKAWQEYAEAFRQRYEEPGEEPMVVGNDGYAGPYWQCIGEDIIKLLSGETGRRLDGGTLDSAIRSIAKNHGVELE